MFITELSIKRPTVSWVMSLILIIFGLFVFWKLPVRELPNGIQPPVVQIQVDYKSAAASIVDQEVTQIVEDVVGGAEGIKNIDSKSENGRSTINVEFDISMLKWEEGNHSEDGIWWKHWYDNVITTTRFHQFSSHQRELDKKYQSIYDEALDYYNKLYYFAER